MDASNSGQAAPDSSLKRNGSQWGSGLGGKRSAVDVSGKPGRADVSGATSTSVGPEAGVVGKEERDVVALQAQVSTLQSKQSNVSAQADKQSAHSHSARRQQCWVMSERTSFKLCLHACRGSVDDATRGDGRVEGKA